MNVGPASRYMYKHAVWQVPMQLFDTRIHEIWVRIVYGEGLVFVVLRISSRSRPHPGDVLRMVSIKD